MQIKSPYLCLVKAADSTYSQCLYFSSNALARKMEKLAIECWKPVGLSPSHAYLLMLVLDNPGIQPTALVEQLLLTPSTITRLMEKLETKKLIVRTTEGKTTNVYATPRAKNMQPDMKQCVNRFYQAYAEQLGRDESSRLVLQMNKLADKLPE